MDLSIPTGKKLLFWGILVAGTLGIAEGTASLWYYYGTPDRERKLVELALDMRGSNLNHAARYIAHPYFNYVSNPDFRLQNGDHPHNAMGLRGPLCCVGERPRQLVRIVAVGGSTTYGMYFQSEKGVWPALLQERLRDRLEARLEVINAGVPNYTTYEMIGFMAMQVPDLSPDIVLIHTGLNDAFTAGFPDEGGPDNTYFRHAFGYRPPPGWLKEAMTASYLLRVLGLRLFSQGGLVPLDMTRVIQHLVPPEEQVARNVQAATGKYFRRNLGTLIALCRHIGATPVLVNMPLNPKFESGQNLYYAAVAEAVQRNNRIGQELAELKQVMYVDLYSEVRDPKLFLDAAHMNRAGMQLKATLITGQLGPLVTQRAGATSAVVQ